MRTKSVLAGLLLAVAGLQTVWAQGGMLVWQDGKFEAYRYERIDSVLFVKNIDEFVEHEYVDLGLPSGTLWATTNIGADSQDDFGNYFSWG